MKKLRLLSLVAVVVLLASSKVAGTDLIKASAIPERSSEATGQQITVPVVVDISQYPEKLGSYTAELSWDVHVLRYIGHSPGATDGFANPVVNTETTSQGKLTFAAANPRGADGKVNVLNVKFECIGSRDSKSSLNLEFFAMAAAYTFADLLPYVETVTGDLKAEELPDEFSISQNQPNPFNPETTIRYRSHKAVHVNLEIYNLLGHKIRTMVNEFQEAGNYEVVWDGRDDTGKNVSNGVYIYKIQAGGFSEIKKMLFVK